MSKENTYRLVHKGKKAVRRDYSKVSGTLELPNLVEIQTKSFDWFKNEGIKEVFEEIYPIKSTNGSITLEFLDYRFEDPKHSVNECKTRELTYSAPLRTTMKLTIKDQTTGEIIDKEPESVYLGEFPMLTPTGTFIINGAERVIVSQIVRSPGAYFAQDVEEKTGRDIYTSELIPARGTWLEFMTDSKKSALGRIINMSVDRKRKILSTILFKAVGLSMNLEKGEDALDDSGVRKFMEAIGLPVYDLDVEAEQRDFLNDYLLLFTGIFGNYEEVANTLIADKIKTTDEALKAVYENQRSDDIHTVEGAKNLMNAKFFDARRYDLNKAGRYKTCKKLGAYARAKNRYLAEDLCDENGRVVVRKDTLVDKATLALIRETLDKGVNMLALPQEYEFSHPDTVSVPLAYGNGLKGRILAETVKVGDNVFEQGTVLTEEDIKAISRSRTLKEIAVYGGIIAQGVELTADNVSAVLNYGGRLYCYGRLLENGIDVMDKDGELVVSRYIPDTEQPILTNAARQNIVSDVKAGRNYTLYLVGAAGQVIYVKNHMEDTDSVKVLGTDPLTLKKTIVISDMYAQYSYMLNMTDEVGSVDDVDQLGNKRIRTVGELIQNQYRIGFSRLEKNVKEKMSISEVSSITAKNLTNIRSLTMAVKEFFSSSQLSQFMDQQNPLAELTNKRRISALGPGGLTRERAGFEVRDVHATHYGRICPIETPEGPNIGLINYLTSYAKINEYGFIQTPYRKVFAEDGRYRVSDEDIIYMSADDEMDYVIAQANEVKDGYLFNDQCVCRYQTETVMMPREEVELVDVSPKQIISVAAACIPFLENDDASRALMGANMQRQAVPLLKPHSPNVGTGMEYYIARDAGSALVAEKDGIVTYVDAARIVTEDNGEKTEYELIKFRRSNAGTCINQTPIVQVGEKVEKGDVIADGPSMENGELALGQNVKIAFMTWNGYNYEDAVIMSERMVKEDIFTSIHIEEYSIECRTTKLGDEEITRDIPNVAEAAVRNLDSHGIIMKGAEVREGDILVGKVTPKGQSDSSPEEKLLFAIFGEKSKEVRDNSLKVPHGGAGIVQCIRRFTRAEHDLSPGVNEVIKVYIVQKRKISEGDKMAGRHGNKGVISKILPQEDMPYMADGTQIDIMLNPFGVPSRMNIGQVLEIHLGLAAEKLGCKFATPVFDGINNEELMSILKEAGSTPDGKVQLFDGRTGEAFDERVAVGVMYMIKLAHMVDDKLHARATGPYSLVTQQPLGGKAQNGGQRFGEMEVWALEAYGAANTLNEILTVKSDDVIGRTRTYEAIIKGKPIPKPTVGESFRVLVHELQALALDVQVFDKDGKAMDISQNDDDNRNPAAPAAIEELPEEKPEEVRPEESIEALPEAIVGFDDEEFE
ncbi:MAG: DNA-directed RNA polymerase subunit beta [Erysipelotrichaceae bacterium]|nr:DNA-directed RNA polymerase subunit beta [Erysipelotrichaceae bacterium]